MPDHQAIGGRRSQCARMPFRDDSIGDPSGHGLRQVPDLHAWFNAAADHTYFVFRHPINRAVDIRRYSWSQQFRLIKNGQVDELEIKSAVLEGIHLHIDGLSIDNQSHGVDAGRSQVL